MRTDYQIAERAIHFIADHQQAQPSLDEIAAHVGLSPHHFQRLFSRWAGISPKRMLQYLTALQAGALLRRRVPLLETSLSVGLSSGSRLHDLFVTMHGMSPAQYRAHGDDLQIHWGVSMSRFGLTLLATTEQGVCWLSFHDEDNLDQGIAQMQGEWFASRLDRDDGRISAVIPGIFDGATPESPMHVLVKGSNFQLKVWEALLSIPSGCTATYGDISRIIGRSGASRAVGSAIGANRVAWLIPCHRVIRGTGIIGGYRWGPHRKGMMLLDEAPCTEPARAMVV
jgi:AraC family transcriptional regulator, regulatory protein of adaptative response / methylated-DNA-[protein]-cysteine methyltransferase